MSENFPIRFAIEKIISLFSFDSEVVVKDYNKDNNDKIWCVVDGVEEEFLRVIAETEKLPPILVISTGKEKDTPLYLFKALSHPRELPDNGFRYLDFPFDIIKFLCAIEDLRRYKGKQEKNPFKALGTLTDELKRYFSKRKGEGKDSDDDEVGETVECKLDIQKDPAVFFRELSRSASDSDNERLKKFHDIKSEELAMQLYLSYQCCWEYLYSNFERRREHNEKNEKKVLWIENNPQQIKKVKTILETFFEIYEIDLVSTEEEILKCNAALENNPEKYTDYDLVLIDMYLGATLNGKDFLELLSQKYPHIPAFIVSASEDLELISNTLKKGADYYILKKYAVSIPHYFRKFHEGIGKTVSLIKNNNELRKNFIGNIRRWRLNRESLWFGDKCYHMINHSYSHAENDWCIMNQLFPVFYEKLCALDVKVTDEDVYCLSMATWLHDIGHSGNEQYGEPHHIRDTHSVISAELILKHPEYYGIYGFDDKINSPYRHTSFRHPKTALQCIRERMSHLNAAMSLYDGKMVSKDEIRKTINKNTLLEKIALLCIYHSSKFPIDEDNVKELTKKRSLSRECYENLDKKTEPIHLASIASLIGDETILKLTSILRFVDALDHNKNRVGDMTFRSIKIETIRRDIRYQISKLEREVELVINFSKINQEKARRFKRLFFEDVERAILEKNYVPQDLKNEQRRFLDSFEWDIDTTNYELLLEYIQFICVQEGHFDLHNSIESIKVDYELNTEDRILMDIKFKTSKDMTLLQNIRIKNWNDQESRTLSAHLLGERGDDGVLVQKDGNIIKWEGYIWKELLASKKYLNDILYLDDIDEHKIGIYDMSEELIYGNKAAKIKNSSDKPDVGI